MAGGRGVSSKRLGKGEVGTAWGHSFLAKGKGTATVIPNWAPNSSLPHHSTLPPNPIISKKTKKEMKSAAASFSTPPTRTNNPQPRGSFGAWVRRQGTLRRQASSPGSCLNRWSTWSQEGQGHEDPAPLPPGNSGEFTTPSFTQLLCPAPAQPCPHLAKGLVLLKMQETLLHDRLLHPDHCHFSAPLPLPLTSLFSLLGLFPLLSSSFPLCLESFTLF